MAQKTILLVSHGTHEESTVHHVLQRPDVQSWIRVARVADVRSLLKSGPIGVILVTLDGFHSLADVGEVLWSCSVAGRTVPVVVLSEQYNEAEALTLFRMGVTDYLGIDEHLGKLMHVIESLIGTGIPSMDTARQFVSPEWLPTEGVVSAYV